MALEWARRANNANVVAVLRGRAVAAAPPAFDVEDV